MQRPLWMLYSDQQLSPQDWTALEMRPLSIATRWSALETVLLAIAPSVTAPRLQLWQELWSPNLQRSWDALHCRKPNGWGDNRDCAKAWQTCALLCSSLYLGRDDLCPHCACREIATPSPILHPENPCASSGSVLRNMNPQLGRIFRQKFPPRPGVVGNVRKRPIDWKILWASWAFYDFYAHNIIEHHWVWYKWRCNCWNLLIIRNFGFELLFDDVWRRFRLSKLTVSPSNPMMGEHKWTPLLFVAKLGYRPFDPNPFRLGPLDDFFDSRPRPMSGPLADMLGPLGMLAGRTAILPQYFTSLVCLLNWDELTWTDNRHWRKKKKKKLWRAISF